MNVKPIAVAADATEAIATQTKLKITPLVKTGIKATAETLKTDNVALNLVKAGKGVLPKLTLSHTLDLTTNKALQDFNAKIDNLQEFIRSWKKFEDLDAETQQVYKDHYENAYGDLEQQKRANDLLKKWAEQGNDAPHYQSLTQKAWIKALKGESAVTEIEQTVAKMVSTRRSRWQKLANKVGIPFPDHFQAYRGAKGVRAVEDAIKAWRDPSTPMTRVHQDQLASWSLDKSRAQAFAQAVVDFDDPEPCGVLYAASIPFEQTLADKWLDGSGFIEYRMEDEVIAGGATPNSIFEPEKDMEVFYKGVRYTYADRAKLFKEWEKLHPSGKK